MKLAIHRTALALCAIASLLVPRIVEAQLRSPWDGQPVTPTDAPYDCPQPPPFAKTLNVEGYYTDAHHSIIDEKKREAEEKATEAPTHLGQWSGEAADAWLTKGSRAAAGCVYSLLPPPPRRTRGPVRCPPARGTTNRSGFSLA